MAIWSTFEIQRRGSSGSEIPVNDISELKKLIEIIKPATLFDDLEDAELKNKRWLKTGTYNAGYLGEGSMIALAKRIKELRAKSVE